VSIGFGLWREGRREELEVGMHDENTRDVLLLLMTMMKMMMRRKMTMPLKKRKTKRKMTRRQTIVRESQQDEDAW
jgi:hypothetical protein